jgi:hypothetical protein
VRFDYPPFAKTRRMGHPSVVLGDRDENRCYLDETSLFPRELKDIGEGRCYLYAFPKD